MLVMIGVEGLRAETTIDPSGMVELSGIVKFEKHYGAPNYGETPKIDEIIMVPILYLDQPISVGANENSGFESPHKNIQKIELASSKLYKKFQILKDKRLKVVGKVFEADNALQFTDVLIDVSKIIDEK